MAILLVVGAHAGVPWLSGGFVGVDVFFVLSGFLITGLLLDEVSTTGRIAFDAFYLRRFRRLMPALVLMIVATSLVALLILSPGEQLQQASTAATAVMWVSNIHFALAQMDYFSQGTDANLFLHTWSLGVEEQFYLVWPLLLLLALGKGQGLARIGRLRWVMLGVALVSLTASVWLTPRLPQFAFYMMPARGWEFAAGALVWLGFRGKLSGMSGKPAGALGLHVAGLLGLGAIMVPAVMYSGHESYPSWRACFPALGAAAVVWAGSHGVPTGVSRWLSVRPLQWLGRISYAWYLWHWPMLLLAYALTGSRAPLVSAVAVLVSLSLATASYRFVEYPVRHQAWWLDRRRMAWMGCAAVIVLVNVLTARWFDTAATRPDSTNTQRYARARSDAPAIYAMGCDDWYRSSELRVCTFGPSDAAHTAVLMGDSVAGQWFPAVSHVFVDAGWRLLVLTKSACPMVDEPFFYARIGREYTECSAWRQRALARVVALHPDVVLLSTVATNDFSRTQWVDGTSRVLQAIDGSVGRIAILRGTPRLPFDGPDCLSSHAGRPKWLASWQVCEAPAADAHDTVVFQWLQQAGARFANVRTIDMNDLVCPQGMCVAERQGTIVYRDAQHLTASFAASLAPELGRRIGMPSAGGAGAVAGGRN